MSKIGIDLDGCVFKSDQIIIDKVNKAFNLNIMYEDVVYDEMLDHFIEPDDMKEFGKIIGDTVTRDSLPLQANAKTVIDILSAMEEIVFISSRHKTSYNATHKQLRSLKLPTYSLYLTGIDDKGEHKEKKSEIINEENVDIFIDDDRRHILDAYRNTDCPYILVFDHPWNRMIKDNSRIFRVKGWIEVAKAYCELLKTEKIF